MNISFNTRDPVYVQVIRYFKQQIAMGILQPGENIPSRRELANQMRINPNTAQRAYKEMEEEGLIKTEKNQPSRVTYDNIVIQSVRDELIYEAVSQFISSMKSINVSQDEAIEIIKDHYKKDERGEQSSD